VDERNLSFLGKDINLDASKIVSLRQFCNKIWQATRFGYARNFDASFERPDLEEMQRYSTNRGFGCLIRLTLLIVFCMFTAKRLPAWLIAGS
jgi:hypothetical protein